MDVAVDEMAVAEPLDYDIDGAGEHRLVHARDVSRRQRRVMRGKAAPSGTRPASDNSGTREKAALLVAAVKRGSKERERRRSTTASHARRALSMKRAAGDPAANRPSSQTSNRGMRPVSDDTRAPSGALNEEGQEIARRRGGGPRYGHGATDSRGHARSIFAVMRLPALDALKHIGGRPDKP